MGIAKRTLIRAKMDFPREPLIWLTRLMELRFNDPGKVMDACESWERGHGELSEDDPVESYARLFLWACGFDEGRGNDG